VVVGNDDLHPQLARQRHLVPVGDAAVGGHQEINTLGEQVAHVGLQQAVPHLPDRELHDHVVRVVREREVEHGGRGDAVCVVVPEDAYALPVPDRPRDPAGSHSPHLLFWRAQGLQRRREEAQSALGQDAPVR
jgi:hypothetical protein